ncbi:MAG: glutathione S-transferase family protein [Hyphomicrobiaceae bacterium]
MGYVLYGNKASGSFPVEAALVKAGAPHRVVELDLSKGDHERSDFVAINPMRQVPALTLTDGTLMTESAAIVIYLAGAHPKAGLSPEPGTPAHARFLRWLVYMATNLYEADLRYFYPDRYTTDPAGVPGVKAAGARHMARTLEVIDQALADGPFLAGRALSIADVYLAVLTTWSPEPVTAPRLLQVRQAVTDDQAYGQVWRAHGLAV